MCILSHRPLTRTKMCQRAGARMVPTVSSTFTYHKIFNNSTMAKHHQAAKQTWTYSSQAKAWGAGDFSALLLLIYLSKRHITFAIVHLVVLTPFLVGQELKFFISQGLCGFAIKKGSTSMRILVLFLTCRDFFFLFVCLRQSLTM